MDGAIGEGMGSATGNGTANAIGEEAEVVTGIRTETGFEGDRRETGPPSTSPEAHGDLPRPQEEEFAFVFHIHDPEDTLSPERVAEAERRVRRRAEELRRLLPETDPAGSPIRIHLYPTVEAKALASGDMSAAHAVPGAREIHLSLQPGLEGDRIAVEAGLILRDAVGAPASRALETGAVMLLSEEWLGAPPEEWAGRLHRAGLVPGLGELLDDEAFASGSRLIFPVAAAAMAKWLLEGPDPAAGLPWDRQGMGRLAELVSGWAPSSREIAELERPWALHLDSLARHADAAKNRPVPPFPPEPPFQQGFNFAHEGYRIHNGFGSRDARRALEHLAGLGTNAVAVLPYTFLADPGQPGPFRIPSRAGAENDEAVTHAVLAAHRQGMQVMMKPQIWLRGSWPGEIRMEGEAEWGRFFQEYARWIGHYAFLAEVHGVASLCLGTELSAAALERPHDWRMLADGIRQVFTGRLGYCANWGEEVETLEFWDALDFVGVSFYYPLSRLPRPSDRALQESAELALDRLEELGRRHRRPVILAEAGFASSPRPWQRPWEEERGAGARVDLEAQARGYRALIQALEGRETIQGVYWWKWPTTGPREPSNHAGFTPAGKPAERIVAEWFRRRSGEAGGW
jgi:hypothetical protein